MIIMNLTNTRKFADQLITTSVHHVTQGMCHDRASQYLSLFTPDTENSENKLDNNSNWSSSGLSHSIIAVFRNVGGA